MTNKKIEQIKKWHEYHGLCIDALLKSFITLDEFNLHEDEFDRFFDTLYPQEPQPETPDELLTDEEILQIAIDSLPESGGLVREVDIEWVKTICQAQLLKATPLIEAPLRERIKELEEQLNTAGLRQARLIRKSGAAPEGEK